MQVQSTTSGQNPNHSLLRRSERRSCVRPPLPCRLALCRRRRRSQTGSGCAPASSSSHWRSSPRSASSQPTAPSASPGSLLPSCGFCSAPGAPLWSPIRPPRLPSPHFLTAFFAPSKAPSSMPAPSAAKSNKIYPTTIQPNRSSGTRPAPLPANRPARLHPRNRHRHRRFPNAHLRQCPPHHPLARTRSNPARP
jgi:hypothetical protein